MEQLSISDLYEVIGGSDSFDNGKWLGKIVGEKVKNGISSAIDFLDGLLAKDDPNHGYNSSGYHGGTNQDGRSHSSAGRYLN